ncbi:MAG: acetate uptake transporter [Rhizomicrobium sp.]
MTQQTHIPGPNGARSIIAQDALSLGLAAFGITTLLASMINAGLLPPAGETAELPLAMTLGGTTQLIAGALAARRGDHFATTAFIAYGAFWWWYAILSIWFRTGFADMNDARPTIGATLLLWGVLALFLWVGSFKRTRLTVTIFLAITITFFVLAAGLLLVAPWLTRIGGYCGMICGTLALYGSFAAITNDSYGHRILPLG